MLLVFLHTNSIHASANARRLQRVQKGCRNIHLSLSNNLQTKGVQITEDALYVKVHAYLLSLLHVCSLLSMCTVLNKPYNVLIHISHT